MRNKRISKDQRRHIVNARRQANSFNERESQKYLTATIHHSHNRVTIDEWEYDNAPVNQH
jgi:hypothetical protein